MLFFHFSFEIKQRDCIRSVKSGFLVRSSVEIGKSFLQKRLLLFSTVTGDRGTIVRSAPFLDLSNDVELVFLMV